MYKNKHPEILLWRDHQLPWVSDVQERRVPSKPTTKRITNGGKQPHKHMLHKMLKWKSTTGGIKKPHRYRLGLLALPEICRYQQSTESLIRRTPFNKLIKEISPGI